MSSPTTQKRHASQRHEIIMRTLKIEGLVTAQQMASLCNVSEMTIRRDFDSLAEQGLLKRAHGGATLPDGASAVQMDAIEPPVDERTSLNRAAKSMIAARAASMVKPMETIAVDIGSTMFLLAQNLVDQQVTVFTTSLKVARVMCDQTPRVYVPGGEVRGTEPSIIGARAVEELHRLMFDIAFIGVSGISAEGVFDYSLEDTEVKKALIERSRRTIILADSSKFDRVSVAHVAGFDRFDMLITERAPPSHISEALEKYAVEVVLTS